MCKKQKQPLTKEERKARRRKRTKTALITIACIILVIGLGISGIAIANVITVKGVTAQAENFAKVEYTQHDQLVPELEDGYWTFTADRDLKILQLTDVHIGGGSFSKNKDTWAMNAVATMIRSEQPDLVIITGDIAYPVPFQAGTFNNLNATKIFSTMMERLGVYWTFAFGNHDTEAYSMYSRKDICEYYEGAGFKYCLFQRGFADDDDKFGHIDRGFGNHIIKVKNSDGDVTQALVMFDSHSYTDGDYFGIQWKYDNIHQSQVDWYNSEMDKIKAANSNGEYAKNLMFFHIPLIEYREAWRAIKSAYQESGKLEKGVEATASKDWTESQEDVKAVYYYGKMGESEKVRHGISSYGVFCGYGTDKVFEDGLTHALQGIFCGHDHYNNFSIEYKGVRLTYGMSVDYLAYPGIYKEHLQRGCTVITVSPDGSFDCSPRNYYTDYNVAHEKD